MQTSSRLIALLAVANACFMLSSQAAPVAPSICPAGESPVNGACACTTEGETNVS